MGCTLSGSMKRFPATLIVPLAVLSLALAWALTLGEKMRWLHELDARNEEIALHAQSLLSSNPRTSSDAVDGSIARFDALRKVRANRGLIHLALCLGDQAAESTTGLNGWQRLCDRPETSRRDETLEAGELLARMNVSGWQDARGRSWQILVFQDQGGLSVDTRGAFLRNWLALVFFLALSTAILIGQARNWLLTYALSLYRALRQKAAGRIPLLPVTSEIPLSRSVEQLTAKILRLPVTIQSPAPVALVQPSEPLADADLLRLDELTRGRRMIVIANREPYIHNRRDGGIEVQRPASGLVTALEPVLRHSGGLWVAHGSGSADAETSDERGMIGVPPGLPSYQLKRVWLSQREEQGYYYGFANEGLWPLCHLAHQSPHFRLHDWQEYRRVNARFASEIPEEWLDDRSLLLVQDYHFALVPRLLKDRRGVGKISLFWHIPWPTAEKFRICPWAEELLHGMLGAGLIGFHTLTHCRNFLESCERLLEARVDRENLSVTYRGHETKVRAFPIGIDTAPVRKLDDREIGELKTRYGVGNIPFIAVGVDRLDYTKGLLERVAGVERFLEKYPRYRGEFCWIQIASPSRTTIPAYQDLSLQLEHAIQRVNDRFGDASLGYLPIRLLARHHDWEEIRWFYQMGQVGLVTPLHDGMNLVAKEYVWCQSEERGSLVLSRFAGASQELTDALLVNPYSAEEIADSLDQAFSLSESERIRRMRSMKEKIARHSAFSWANDLIEATLESSPEAAPSTLPGVRIRTGT